MPAFAIRPATLQTYSQWIRGDVLKKHKQESYLLELVHAIIKRYGSQITWNSLAQDLSIDSPKTVADYLELLVNMDAVFILPAILEDKLVAAPKKAKKVMFTDPFIFHAMNYWLHHVAAPYTEQIQPFLQDKVKTSSLVEALVATTIRRKYRTFYIKGTGEVDIAYVDNNKFWPIEIKWTTQIRKSDLQQILKYPNGQVWGKTARPTNLKNILNCFLPLELAKW